MCFGSPRSEEVVQSVLTFFQFMKNLISSFTTQLVGSGSCFLISEKFPPLLGRITIPTSPGIRDCQVLGRVGTGDASGCPHLFALLF